jgi:S-DNA-T family DNA segregation ATPase FtsK/SpoIIIE
MARAAARGRRSRSAAREVISRRVVQECLGVGLLGLALLLALALASFSPADPVFEAVSVENRAGIVGASAAALLLGTLGLGAAVVVGVLAVIGVRLVLGIGVPRLASRFWVGAGLLLLAAASLPPLLERGFGGRVAELPDGALGRFLAAGESLMVGSWGALLLNAAVALIGVLSLTGISTGAALHGVGVVLGWLGGALAAVAIQIGEACAAVARAAHRGALELLAGVRRGFRTLLVWREQRRRRVRVASARLPAPQPEEELQPGPVLRERARAARGGDPMIVDHAADRDRERTERQEVFRFEEHGPYRLPDISIFERSATGPREYDRDSLIMNSRILEKKLADFGIGGRVITVHPGPVITMYEFEPASGASR